MARRTVASVVAVLAVIATAAAVTATPSASQQTGRSCPSGYQLGNRSASTTQLTRSLDAVSASLPNQSCIRTEHPESVYDVAALTSQRADAAAAPYTSVPTGAYRAAVDQRAALIQAAPAVANANGQWTPLGSTPLIGDVYPSVAGEGLADLSGRIDSYDYDPVHGRLFATIGTGGVWMSTDLAKHWTSVGDGLPSQIVGAVGWVPSDGVDASVGGTLVVVGGEPLTGGDTHTGLGAFWSNNLGDTWHQATGIPDGAMGYQVAPDPAHPLIVYIATSMGLFRSTNAGRSFGNVRLPTTDGEGHTCAGVTGYNHCQFSNFVTDVVVQAPGGTTSAAGGTVLAAVGYRAGTTAKFTNGQLETTANGLYRSTTGVPGSFTKLAASNGLTGFAPEDRIGRTELGQAIGPQQNHNYVYAIVQDACVFNGGVPVIDVPEGNTGSTTCTLGLPGNTVLNGVYVSSDFGTTWTVMGNVATIAENPATGSALVGTSQAMMYAPGVQAWYNEWIKPDPTVQNATGVPTRLTFGLEEIWESQLNLPQNGPMAFHVIGPYFSGDTCLFLNLGLPSCPTTGTGPADKTTHPDQHDAIFVPDKSGGGVTLVVGNDGGSYTQHANAGQDFSNKRWGRGNQNGLHTLLPYGAEPAKDGTVYFGLQDNGEGKLTPDNKQYEIYGGDAFYSAVNPNNSNQAVEEYTLAVMHYTKDGGKNWTTITPSAVSNPQFNNPFVMDATHAGRLLTAGPEVVESADWGSSWKQVYTVGSANQMSAVALRGAAAYVGFCGVCDIINAWDTGFHNGLATNVAGSKAGAFLSTNGWHNAAMHGLPNRMITSIAIDPSDAKTVYVALGGYNYRDWVPPGSYLDTNKRIGSGHVFVSHDGGNNFSNASGNLPNAVTNAIEIHGNQLIVGTDVGAFISNNKQGSVWAALGGSALPAVPISSIKTNPGADNLLTVATFGRGLYCYQLPGSGSATCANRGANFNASEAGNTKLLATTGLHVGLPVTGGLLIAAALLLATRRRRRTT
jgi:hypothetical protein